MFNDIYVESFRKYSGEKEKMLVTSIPSFSHNVSPQYKQITFFHNVFLKFFFFSVLK